MDGVLWILVPVVCMVGMGLMMWFMAKGMGGSQGDGGGDRRNLAELRDEHRRLGAEIERREDESTRSQRIAARDRH